MMRVIGLGSRYLRGKFYSEKEKLAISFFSFSFNADWAIFYSRSSKQIIASEGPKPTKEVGIKIDPKRIV